MKCNISKTRIKHSTPIVGFWHHCVTPGQEDTTKLQFYRLDPFDFHDLSIRERADVLELIFQSMWASTFRCQDLTSKLIRVEADNFYGTDEEFKTLNDLYDKFENLGLIQDVETIELNDKEAVECYINPEGFYSLT